MKTLRVRGPGQWRDWLRKHHASESEVWLVFYKRHTGTVSIDYKDALDEALCFGWIDSLIRRLDDDRYARKFTPRRPESRWSAVNRKRYAQLRAAGRLRPPGIARAPTRRSAEPRRMKLPSKLPGSMQKALRENPAAGRTWRALPPGQRRLYCAWIESAKREETKQRRLEEATRLLNAGKVLGLK